MEVKEAEERIADLEQQLESIGAEMSDLSSQLHSLTEFAAILLGRFADGIDRAPDLGLPTAPLFTDEYEAQMRMLLSYNENAGKA